MANKINRKIVKIDENKCNGCGLCIPNCAEGAIRIIDGKARLLAENLCDGLGACLGKCPMDAITVEERPAEEFDEQAVDEHLSTERMLKGAIGGGCPGSHVAAMAGGGAAAHGGCPGSRMRMLQAGKPAAGTGAAAGGTPGKERPSQLAHWPVQLALVPPKGPMWQDADVLIAADCVAFAYADFHEKLLAGRSLAIACPKLDDVGPYVEKLAMIFAGNSVRSVTVAHMEVPCCSGIVYAVEQAIEQSGRNDITLRDITIGVDGTIRREA